MTYKVVVEKRAVEDIQEAVNYYDEKSSEAGTKFINEVTHFLKALELNPNYQIRYSNVRCLALKKFPFLIHFSLEDIYVFVHAITHTSISPTKWPRR